MSFAYWRLNVLNSCAFCCCAEWKFFDSGGTQIATTGGTASASSSSFGAAANAFDGSAATFWSSGGPATPAAPVWLQYHFASAIDAASFSLTTRNDGSYYEAPEGFELQASNDGITWTSMGFYSVPSPWDTAGQTKTVTVNSASGTGAAWRLLITASQSGGICAIQEWQLFDSGGSPISATGGIALATNEFNGTLNAKPNGPLEAFDGDTASAWASRVAPSVGSPAYLEYRFTSATVTVGSFCIRDNTAAQGPTAFSLQSSPDGATWTTVGTYTTTWASTSQLKCGFTNPTLVTAQPQIFIVT